KRQTAERLREHHRPRAGGAPRRPPDGRRSPRVEGEHQDDDAGELEEPALDLVPEGGEEQDDQPARRELGEDDRRHAGRTPHAPSPMPRTSLPARRPRAAGARPIERDRAPKASTGRLWLRERLALLR